MDQPPNPQPESEPPARPRWQIAAFQLLFGTMAVGLGGFLSAEPTLSLDRHDDGRLECRYAFNVYGRFPVIAASIHDLVRYDVTQSQQRGVPSSSSSRSGSPTTSYTLRLIGRDGSEIAVGQTWDLTELDRMIAGNRDRPSHQERIVAGFPSWITTSGFLIIYLSLSDFLWARFSVRSPPARQLAMNLNTIFVASRKWSPWGVAQLGKWCPPLDTLSQNREAGCKLNPDKPKTLPHPDDLAARKALAKRSPVPLESVLIQMEASEEWRKKHSSSSGSPARPLSSPRKSGVR